VVAWRDYTNIIYATSTDAGDTWSEPDLVYPGDTTNQDVSLAANATGDWMMTWESYDPYLPLASELETPIFSDYNADLASSLLCGSSIF
jgi:hypothetical protein